MSVIGSSILAGASGSAAGGDKVYVDDVFSTYLYDGNNSSQSINNGIDLAGEGGLVWIKVRSMSDHNSLVDTERGPINGWYPDIMSNEINQQTVRTYGVSQINSNGFTVGGSNTQYNATGQDYVAWSFRKALGYFDVVTYTGTGSARTIAHNLGSVPGMIIVKVYAGGTDNWFVYHRSLGDQRIKLDKTDASGATAVWNNTAPTSSVFSVGTDGGVNGSGESYVAYIFAHDDASFGTNEDESIIKCGSYTGNAGVGPSINLGFEPQWVMIKNTSTGNVWTNWAIFDNMRGVATGVGDIMLHANTTDAEESSYTAHTINLIDFTSTGFNIDPPGNQYTVINQNNDNYIYMAIRRPNKPPEAATDVFAIDTKSAGRPGYTSNFPVDLVFNRNNINSSDSTSAETRLTSKQLITNSSDAEGFDMSDTFRCNTGWDNGGGVDTTDYAWMFKRAPGFMDVVTFSGNGTAGRTVAHNLTSVPEMMIVKRRDVAEEWVIYHKTPGPTKYHKFNSQAALTSAVLAWNDTAPTSSSFTLGDHARTNGTGATYVNYLFATLPGISKVGSYDGSSSDINIDCGFTNGARFVLIKRTDGTGDWCLFDTLRGLVSGNDPLIKLNGSSGQDTGNDIIDPLSSGFTVVGGNSFVNNVNAGAKYIFLAIA